MDTERLRILHCIPGLDGGGAERQLSYLARALGKKGVDVHVAYHLRGARVSKIPESSVTFHELTSHGNHDPSLLWQLFKITRRLKPDLIQTWLLQMDVLGGLAALVTRTPYLTTERVVAAGYSGMWKVKLRSWIGARAALVVANSQGGREYWLGRKPPDFVRIVPNAVPVEDVRHALAPYPETCGAVENKEILLFAGRYCAQKNVLILLDALFLVLSERPAVMALFVGSGPLESELVDQVKRHHMEDRVKILGYTEQLWGWMKRARAFVSVSLFEGSPNVVGEAAAAGCPLVLSDIPEHRALVGDDSAYFVPCHAPAEIARGILDVLRNPEEASGKAELAYARVSGFTVNSIADQYLELYNLAIKR
jgi:glycosyltransferase involved in cell wall biosynthesis